MNNQPHRSLQTIIDQYGMRDFHCPDTGKTYSAVTQAHAMEQALGVILRLQKRSMRQLRNLPGNRDDATATNRIVERAIGVIRSTHLRRCMGWDAVIEGKARTQQSRELQAGEDG